MKKLQFKVHNSHSEPFAYFEGEGAFLEPLTDSLIDWLRTDAPWKFVKADFYEQFEFDLMSEWVPEPLEPLKDPAELNHLKRAVESHFGIRLRSEIDVTVHKLVSGQRIRVHNDFLPQGETHRLILQLNPDWAPDCGGYLMLFRGNDPEQVARVIPPTMNSLFGFAIGPSSFHAVSAVKKGERLTLVYSFYEER